MTPNAIKVFYPKAGEIIRFFESNPEIQDFLQIYKECLTSITMEQLKEMFKQATQNTLNDFPDEETPDGFNLSLAKEQIDTKDFESYIASKLGLL